jgi:hypothetical protein
LFFLRGFFRCRFLDRHLIERAGDCQQNFSLFRRNQMNQNQLQRAAINYSEAGLATLPINDAKCPTVKSWTQLQTVKPTTAQINQWFGGSMPEATGLAIIAGKISGNIEIIDVDCKYDLTGEMMKDFSAIIKEHLPELFPNFSIAKTVNGGFHIIYRAPADSIQGNRKLASRPATRDEAAKGDKVKVLIETRGEGGYIAAAPTAGYEWIQGSFKNIPLITAEQREILLTIARSFDQMRSRKRQRKKPRRKNKPCHDHRAKHQHLKITTTAPTFQRCLKGTVGNLLTDGAKLFITNDRERRTQRHRRTTTLGAEYFMFSARQPNLKPDADLIPFKFIRNSNTAAITRRQVSSYTPRVTAQGIRSCRTLPSKRKRSTMNRRNLLKNRNPLT